MLAIFSKDSGGAEILSSYVKRLKCKKIYILENPALEIFKKKIPKLKNLKFKDIKKIKIDNIITSTSRNKKHELSAIKYAKDKNIYSISVLDNWSNYKKRFKKKNYYLFPDEIWTVDKSAFNLAKSNKLPNVKLKKNYFLEDIFKDYNNLKIKERNIILYLDSTLKNKNKQRKRIVYFLKKIKKINKEKKYQIFFRPHPSEKEFFYKRLLKMNEIQIINIKKETLLKSIAKSSYVFGCNSMGMYISSKLKKKVINALPENDSNFNIPIKNKSIENFKISD